MSLLDALRELRLVADRFDPATLPFDAQPVCFGDSASAYELEDLQRLTGHLPAEYVEFLRTHRSVDAHDVGNGFYLRSPVALAHLIGTSSVPSRILFGREPHLHQLTVVPIGGTGGGDQFLLSTTDPHVGAVFLWDHEAHVRFDGTGRDGITLVATSFAAYLRGVAQQWTIDIGGRK